MNPIRSIISASLTALIVTSVFLIYEKSLIFYNHGESALGQISSAKNGPKKEIAKDLNEREASVLFLGDMMLDRQVRRLVDENGSCSYPFSLIDPFLDGFDVAVANLEGPITGNPSESVKNNGLRFTQPMECLSEIGERFQALSLANNHILDFGRSGFDESKKNLSMAGVGYFGDYHNSAGNFLLKEVNGIKISFVGWNEFSWTGTEHIISDIERARLSSDFVVVMPHWGEEYEIKARSRQKTAAGKFVAAGADLIIGSHPHVIQEMGEIDGKFVFYSLGNFIFDQYFKKETTEGMAIALTLKKTDGGVGANYRLIPIKISGKSQPYIAEAAAANLILENLSEISEVSDIIKVELTSGEIRR